MTRDYLTLGLISAVVAGDAEAVGDMMLALARVDATWASDVLEALNRGQSARQLSVGACAEES